MEENKSKKKQVNKKVLISIIGIIIAIALVGVSYAVWHYTFNGTLKNTISTNDISLDLLESNENIINIENALPMGCTEGKQQQETFDFAVTSKTTKDTKINYTISIQKLEVDNGYTALQDNQIAVYLTDYTETNELLSGNYFSYPGCSAPKTEYCWVSKIGSANACYDTLQECQNDTSRGSNSCIVSNFPGGVEGVSLVSQLDNYKLYSGTHVHNSTHNKVQDKFKLRAWIAPDVDASSWNASTKLQYKFKIGVNGEEKQPSAYPEYVYRYGTNTVVNGEPLEQTTATKWVASMYGFVYVKEDTQAACEEKKLVYGISDACTQESVSWGIGTYTEDYTTLNKTFFLKHNISNEGTVESSEVCFIRNNTLYCLKGEGATYNSETHQYNNDSIYYQDNENLILEAFGPNAVENNVCSVYSSDVYCSASGLGAGANQDGGVSADDGSSDCEVYGDGMSNCNE